jgi:hypothetical protein
VATGSGFAFWPFLGSLSPSKVGRTPVADADEFENSALTSIAEARLSQTQNACVAAGAISESGGDFVEQHAHRLLIAE